MSYVERFAALASVRDGSLLDAAIMTPNRLEDWRLDIANTCNNGHSTTKLFTSVAIGMLWDEGKLDLHESAAALFPECWPKDMDAKWKGVTLENVLCHRIGFEETRLDFEGDGVCGSGEDCLKLVFALPLPHAQGVHYQYSDAAYYLLSRVVEAKSGMTLETFIRRRMGIPMGFRDFAMASCPLGHTLGGGCMYARASDMVKLGFLLSNGGIYGRKRLLSEGYIQLMTEKAYGVNRFRDHEIYIKTGAYGQGIAFSREQPIAAAWHRTPYLIKPEPDRNDTMLVNLQQLIDEIAGKNT